MGDLDAIIAATLAEIDPELTYTDIAGNTRKGGSRWGKDDRFATGTTDPGDTTDEEQADGQDHEAEPSSFARLDLTDVITGHYTQPAPDLLHRDDGKHLIYKGMVNGIHGDSGTGKSWLIVYTAAQIIRSGGLVLYLDLEDTPSSIVARLRLAGLTDEQILSGLDYRRPTESFTQPAVDCLCADLARDGHELVVIDSLGEAFALDGINEDKDNEVGPWLRHVARPMADTGAAVALVDHSTKAADNPLFPSGSKRKRAAITGASYFVEAIDSMAKDRGGRLRMTCAKDRHGTYARKEVVADFVMGATEVEGANPPMTLYSPTVRPGGSSAAIEVIILAQKMVAVVRDAPALMSKATLKASVKGQNEKRIAALDHAVNSGSLDIEPGPHGAHLLRFVRDLEVPNE